MNDLISRQDALKGFAEYSDGWCYINALPSAQPERHYCRECKWVRCHVNLDKYGRSETYWHCTNWFGGTNEEGFCHEWERRTV